MINVKYEWSELVESCQPYQVKLTTCQSLAWVRSECWVNSNKLCFLNSATAEAFMQLSHLHGAASTQLHLRTMISELGYSELMTIVIYSKLRATFDDHVMWTLLQLRIDWSELSCTEKECVNKKSELNCFYHDCGSACPTFDPGRLLNQFLFLGKKIFWHPPISLTLNNEGSVTFLFFIEPPLSFDHVNWSKKCFHSCSKNTNIKCVLWIKKEWRHLMFFTVCPSVCLSFCLPVHLSVCPSVCLSICLSVDRMFVYQFSLSVHLSVCLSVHLSVCPSVCLLAACLSVNLSPCPSVSLSFCLPVHLSACHSWASLNENLAAEER